MTSPVLTYGRGECLLPSFLCRTFARDGVRRHVPASIHPVGGPGLSSKKTTSLDAAKTSGTSPSLQPRGLRIEQAAQYTGLSPFFIEECIRNGELLSYGGPGSGVSAAHIVTREHLDQFI